MANTLASIAPGFVLWEKEERPSHLILPDLLETDKLYSDYYSTHKFPLCILDNGAFERKFTPLTELIKLANKYHCTHIVMPDDIGCLDPLPLNTFKMNWEVLRKNAKHLIPVYVVHGRSVDEYARAGIEALKFQMSLSNPESMLVALPSICLRRYADGSPQFLRPRAVTKMRCGWMNSQIAAGKDWKIPHIHLFGAVSTDEVMACATQLRMLATNLSLDTCDPVKLATSWNTQNPYLELLNLPTLLRRYEKYLELYEQALSGPSTTHKEKLSPSTSSAVKVSTSISDAPSSILHGVTTKEVKRKTSKKR